MSWQRETGGRQTEGNEERLGGGNEPGRCSLGLVLNGFILFFNNLEEAQQRVFMVCAIPQATTVDGGVVHQR